MDKSILKIFTIFMCCSALFGCQQKLSYDYLMQHPEVLQKEYEKCRAQSTASCDEVVRAAEDFRLLTQQRAENPELMGLQIMQAQMSGDEKKVKVLYAVVRATSPE